MPSVPRRSRLPVAPQKGYHGAMLAGIHGWIRHSGMALAVASSLSGCDDGAQEVGMEPGGHAHPVSLVSYNLANEGDGQRGWNLAAHIGAMAPDFVAAQECAGCEEWLLSALDGAYEVTAPPRSGVTILYRSAEWFVTDGGIISLGQNDDGWGERVAAWAQFSRSQGDDRLHVYSTHWCVTVRRPDDECDVARQLDYAETLTQHLEERPDPSVPVLLAGDLNVFDGFENGAVVAYLLDSGLVDVIRVGSPDDDGPTFQGNSWAPAGRIDYVFASQPVQVIDAYIDRTSVPDGEGSDHYALVADVQFGSSQD